MKSKFRKLKILFLFLFLISCSSFESSLKKASKLSAENKDQQALNFALRAMSRARSGNQKKKALKLIAEICEKKLKDFKCSINTYNDLLPFSTSPAESETYHFRLGEIYFSQFQDYENALTHFSEVVETCSNEEICIDSRIKISRSYYYKKEFLQSINEIEMLYKAFEDKKKTLDKTRFVESAILHSQALMGLAKYSEAATPLENALSTYLEEANKQQVPILLSVAFRENSDYQKALNVLEKYREENKDPIAEVFIENQIEKMRKRLELQPGGPTGTSRRR